MAAKTPDFAYFYHKDDNNDPADVNNSLNAAT